MIVGQNVPAGPIAQPVAIMVRNRVHYIALASVVSAIIQCQICTPDGVAEGIASVEDADSLRVGWRLHGTVDKIVLVSGIWGEATWPRAISR